MPRAVLNRRIPRPIAPQSVLKRGDNKRNLLAGENSPRVSVNKTILYVIFIFESANILYALRIKCRSSKINSELIKSNNKSEYSAVAYI
jgi:hypothetical protein